MLRTILIDDEVSAIKSLEKAINQHCPDIAIVGKCLDLEAAFDTIEKINPDLVFLKIEMPGMSGFEFLNSIKNIDFDIIMTTSFPDFAAKAFRINATDFLLKPILIPDLIEAVKKVETKRMPDIVLSENLATRRQKTRRNFNKIPLSCSDGIEFVSPHKVLYCKSEGSYTYVIMENRKALIAKQLGVMEDVLTEHDFLRIHRSYIVNLNHIEKYFKNDGGYLMMSNGDKVGVSRRKKEQFLQLF